MGTISLLHSSGVVARAVLVGGVACARLNDAARSAVGGVADGGTFSGRLGPPGAAVGALVGTAVGAAVGLCAPSPKSPRGLPTLELTAEEIRERVKE